MMASMLRGSADCCKKRTNACALAWLDMMIDSSPMVGGSFGALQHLASHP
jgi:hypothetical protein